MKISLVIPAYNEEFRLNKTLPTAIDYMKGHFNDYEIIVVNDGSKDNTLGMLADFSSSVKILSYPQNMGKGFALKTGVKEAQGDYIYIADSDFSTPIAAIAEFIKTMDETGADCVIGSRALKQENIKVSFIRKLLGNVGNLAIRVILGLKFKDTQCGFKMFNQKSKGYFLKCENNRWGYDFEFLYLLNKNNLKTIEIPVEWEAVGESKVKPLDYFKTLKELINVRIIHK